MEGCGRWLFFSMLGAPSFKAHLFLAIWKGPAPYRSIYNDRLVGVQPCGTWTKQPTQQSRVLVSQAGRRFL